MFSTRLQGARQKKESQISLQQLYRRTCVPFLMQLYQGPQKVISQNSDTDLSNRRVFRWLWHDAHRTAKGLKGKPSTHGASESYHATLHKN